MQPTLSKKSAWESFDLTVVRERFRVKSPFGRYADRLEQETRRFLYLSAFVEAGAAPSPLVDEFWHAIILNTQLYRAYCEAAFGKLIEHEAGIPKTSEKALSDYEDTYKRTLAAYMQHFGSPDEEIWPNPDNAVKKILARYQKPYRLHLETTNHCNLHCEHCYPESSHKQPHHDSAVIYRVLDEAKRKKVSKITLTGGEILTRPDWQDVITRALDVTDNLYFITNGLLLSEEKLAWLAHQKTIRSLRNFGKSIFGKRPVEIGLAISLDGLKGNELVRKSAGGISVKADQILKKIELATKYGLHVTVNTTVTNSVTAKELPEMYDILSKLNIDRWQLDQAYLAGRLHESDLKKDGLAWLEICKEGYKYIVRNYLKEYPQIPNWRLEIVQVFRYDNLFYGFKPASSLEEHPCSYHFGSVIVEKGDEVRFCPSLRTAGIGRLSNHGTLDSVYESSSEFKAFLEKGIKDLPCKSCRYGRLFHGGCRANSFAYGGTVWDRDPICCSLSPFVEDEIVPMLPKHIQDNFMSSVQGGYRPGDPEHPATSSLL
jgi:radical SAM protein with 4Fe4S-binding SPASM domain